MKIFGFEDYQVLNESFKNGKLRNIIQQHGMPKYEQDRKFLYDLQDDEILGVMDFDEWYDFHRENKNSYHIVLEDGKYLVLGNIDTLKYYADDEDFQKEFKKRRDERHPGNELNDVPAHERQNALEDETTKHFREKKEELIHSRNIASFKDEIGDIAKFIETIREYFEEHIRYSADDIISDYKNYASSKEYEFEIEVKDNPNIDYIYGVGNVIVSDPVSRSGAKYYDLTVTPESFEIVSDEIDDVFNVTELSDDLGNLLSPFELKDVEGDITDYYNYYGVSRGDFF